MYYQSPFCFCLAMNDNTYHLHSMLSKLVLSILDYFTVYLDLKTTTLEAKVKQIYFLLKFKLWLPSMSYHYFWHPYIHFFNLEFLLLLLGELATEYGFSAMTLCQFESFASYRIL